MSEYSFTIEQVKKLYIGKGNSCRCGCGGEYIYPSDESGLIESNAKRIERYLKKFASGKYPVDAQEAGAYDIYEIDLSRSGNTDRVATLYIAK